MSRIDFVVTSELLYYADDLLPQPTIKFIPEWFKQIRPILKNNYQFNKFKYQKNISSCPSFIDVFNEGYVLLAPIDYIIKVDTNGEWAWEVPIKFDKDKGNNIPEVDVHNDNQMVEFLPEGADIKKVFKLNLPLEIFTPKGYSCRQIPFPYSFNSEWEAAYGLLKTDKIHEASLQIYIKTNKEILIKQGTPLCVYIPFKRKKYKMKVHNYNNSKKYKKLANKNVLRTIGNYRSQYFKLHHKT